MLYNYDVCVFDITNAIVDGIPCSGEGDSLSVDECDLINIQKINPLYHVLDEKILFVPNSVFDQVDKEIAEYYSGYLPSIHGDSLRLGVLLSVVLPFVTEKARMKEAIQVWEGSVPNA